MSAEAGTGPLDGQVALVTGAGRGLGREIAEHLLSVGAKVAFAARGSGVVELCEGLASTHGAASVMAVHLDVMRAEDWDQAVRDIEDRLGPIDILVNNAGDMIGANPLVDVSDADWEYAFHVNTSSVFYGCKAVAPSMCSRRRGTIVNITSFFADIPQPMHAAYCSSKAATRALSQSLALELAPHGVTVNALAPGYMESAMYRGALESIAAADEIDLAEAERRVLAQIPLGRVGTGSELGATVAFLASGGGRYFTAQSLVQGGGVLYR